MGLIGEMNLIFYVSLKHSNRHACANSADQDQTAAQV